METNQHHPISHGCIVKLKESFLNEPIGTLAYVYENYSLGEGRWNGVSLITENGVDLGGFSEREQVDYLEAISQTGYRYRFINMIQLGEDYEKGVFTDVFEKIKNTLDLIYKGIEQAGEYIQKNY